MLVKDTPGAYGVRTRFTEVLNFFFDVLLTASEHVIIEAEWVVSKSSTDKMIWIIFECLENLD